MRYLMRLEPIASADIENLIDALLLAAVAEGAAGAYNVLEGDTDGQFGSGATGRVIIDSGDPEKGFKSYDWWGVIRAYKKGWSAEHKAETFSAIGWDRWVLRRLYATGGDGGSTVSKSIGLLEGCW